MCDIPSDLHPFSDLNKVQSSGLHTGWSGVNRRTDRLILKIFLLEFRIHSESLTDFRILQLQQIADSSILGARILDIVCRIKIFLPEFRTQGEFG